MIVRIDKSTIRRNPEAGQRLSYLPGMLEIRFDANKQAVQNLLDEDDYFITMEEFESGNVSGYLKNFDKLSELQKVATRIETKRDIIDVRCAVPPPEYLYEYENPLIKCEECSKDIRLSDIKTIEDEDGRELNICPNCDEIDSFNIKYERLDFVIESHDKGTS